MAQKPRRLTPKPDVLRELFLLSGNNCAMPQCKQVIIDSTGVMVGRVCHIEAAMPDGPRFNATMTNDQRRAISNLVLLCGGHHSQIDSKKAEAKWPIAAVRKIKADHEAKFRGLDATLQRSFESSFVDNTDALDPTPPNTFSALEKYVPDCKVEAEDHAERLKEVTNYLKKMSRVPDTERDFMLAVIKRAEKLGDMGECISVDVYDLNSALGLSHGKIRTLGEALDRYSVGRIDHDGDRTHAIIYNPSDFVGWGDIVTFCNKSGRTIDQFVLHLKFGLLG